LIVDIGYLFCLYVVWPECCIHVLYLVCPCYAASLSEQIFVVLVLNLSHHLHSFHFHSLILLNAQKGGEVCVLLLWNCCSFDKNLIKRYGEHNLLSIIHIDLDNSSFGFIACLFTKTEEPWLWHTKHNLLEVKCAFFIFFSIK